MSDADDGLTLRRVATRAEYDACVRLQYETWGAGFREAVPASVLQVAQEVGGVVAGAFDAAGGLAGFVFGLTGVRDGRLVHWSDMLAVRPERRARGLGARLKHFQRELVRPLGVETILWTFDPLVARNAHLNLARLGARVVEYVEDMYGDDTGSALHGPLGTDRLIVAWNVAPGDGGAPRAGGGDGPTARIEVPPDVHALLARDPAAAVRWRHETRRAFHERLADGWRVVAFAGGPAEPRPHYLLAPPDLTG